MNNRRESSSAFELARQLSSSVQSGVQSIFSTNSKDDDTKNNNTSQKGDASATTSFRYV